MTKRGDPTLLYGLGATKAGTSWLYRVLDDHPECHMRAVKEVHYWDTMDQDERAKKLVSFEQAISRFAKAQAEAKATEQLWKVKNIGRRIADLKSLHQVIENDRTDDFGYVDWLYAGAEQAKLVGDITPSYALLPKETLTRMAGISENTKFVFLLRDPLQRLWSHVRMHAKRKAEPGQDLVEKSNNTLWRVLKINAESHIVERGDYQKTVETLWSAVPKSQVFIGFMEHVLTRAGLHDLLRFLGLSLVDAPVDIRINTGMEAPMRKNLGPKAIRMLRGQYDWVEKNIGDLPDAWHASLAKGN